MLQADTKYFAYSGWFLAGWIIHFCLGYYIDRIRRSDAHKWLYPVGLAGILVNVAGMTFFPGRFKNPTDLTPSFILACAGVLTFLSDKTRVTNPFAMKIIHFLAKHTFFIYLVHYNIVFYVTPVITGRIPVQIRYFCSVLVTFILSLAIALLLNLMIDPCKRLLHRVFAQP